MGGLEGAELELSVERVAHQGVFVAHAAGRVVFVPDVLPGERALVRVTEDRHGSFLRAEALAIRVASPDRRPHVWPAAAIDRAPVERAGGAEFGHIAPERQRALKAEVLVDALVRIGRLPAEEVAALAADVQAVAGPADGTRSRTRVRLHVDAAGRVGPFAARSRRVVPVAELPLGVAALEDLLPGLDAPSARTRSASRSPGRSAGRRRPEAATIDLVAPGAGPAFAHVGGASARPPITEVVGGRELTLEATGFWQVHPAAPEALSSAVRRALLPDLTDPDAANLDLYGGVGLLAAALADATGGATAVTSVEADRRASGHAARNLSGVPGAGAVAARVEAFLEAGHVAAPASTVVLDPPRSGAGERVVDLIAARGPAQIVYVACDPVALARDAGRLVRHGYRLHRLEALDLFPNTHHLEAVAGFARA